MKIKFYVELGRSQVSRVVEFNRDFKDAEDAYDCPDVSDALEEFVQDSVSSWLEIVHD